MGYPTAYRASLVGAYQSLEQARQLVDALKTTPAMRGLAEPFPDAITPAKIEQDLTDLRDWVYSQMGA